MSKQRTMLDRLLSAAEAGLESAGDPQHGHWRLSVQFSSDHTYRPPNCWGCGRPWADLEANAFLPVCVNGDEDVLLKVVRDGPAIPEGWKPPDPKRIEQAVSVDFPAPDPDAEPMWVPEEGPMKIDGILTAWQKGDFGFNQKARHLYEEYSRRNLDDWERRNVCPPPEGCMLTSWPPSGEKAEKDLRRAVAALLQWQADREEAEAAEKTGYDPGKLEQWVDDMRQAQDEKRIPKGGAAEVVTLDPQTFVGTTPKPPTSRRRHATVRKG